MAIKDALLPEYDHEMGTARRVLERVPEDKLTWQPHEKSMTLGRLATHLAEIPEWVVIVLNHPEFNMTGNHSAAAKTSRADILALFDKNVQAGRALLDAKSDAELMAPWTFKRDGQTMFSMPGIAAVRAWVMNHTIHHRGQLSVYLRLTNTPVPAIYGPSADEGR
jgi:uncharacterized damage-inducible protein DinB